MPVPENTQLYEQVKSEINKLYPKHSAYRSGLLVQEYKRRGGTYTGKKPTTKGIVRWYQELWSNQRGESFYRLKSDIFRPTIRITEDTPITLSELTPQEIERARREKYSKGRVKKFK